MFRKMDFRLKQVILWTGHPFHSYDDHLLLSELIPITVEELMEFKLFNGVSSSATTLKGS